LEKPFLRCLANFGLPTPICQYPVGDRGREIAVIDFAYPNERIAMETDGYRFHSDPKSWSLDRERRNRLTAGGWLLLHATDGDIKAGGAKICGQIAEALRFRRQSRTNIGHE
jgi:very-short-patch-repair endonuclease